MAKLRKALDMGMGPRVVSRQMSKFNSSQMSWYIEWLLKTYAERGLYIPDADPFYRERGLIN